MRAFLRRALRRGLLSCLLALGLVLPLLRTLDLTGQWLPAAGLAAALTLAMACAAQDRRAHGAAWGVIAAAGLVWLFAAGGLQLSREILRAVVLRANGFTAALPMYAGETAVLLAAVVALSAHLFTSEKAGAVPAAAAVALTLTAVWLGDAPQALPLFVPSAAAVVALAAGAGGEGTRLRRVLPVAVVLSALAILPVTSGVTIGPLKEKADELRRTFLDYFFFTEPRTVFSLANEGYYPQGAGQLGGPAAPNSHPVMLVRTDRTAYLRGAVRDAYTGRSWLDTTGGGRCLWVSRRWRAERSALFDEALPDELLRDNSLLAPRTVTVRMVAGNVSSMFVPQRIRSLEADGDLVPYFNSASEVFATRDQADGDTYTVTAPLPLAGDAGLDILTAACAEHGDPERDAEIAARYTLLPGHLEGQVYDLAREACAGAETPYEQALAISGWLQRRCTYTLTPGEQDAGLDFVTDFVLSGRTGNCVYFASAETVLCRMVGIPARYVEGYIARPDADGTARVTGLDAHAWCEIWLSGFGWLTVDATPPEGRGGGQSDEPQATPTPPPPESTPEPSPSAGDAPTPTPAPGAAEPETTPEPTPDVSASDSDVPEDEPPLPAWLKWLLAALLLAALLALALWLRLRAARPERLAAKAPDEMGRWLVWMQAVSDALAVAGYRRGRTETLAAFFRRLDAKGLSAEPLAPLGDCAALVFYGDRDPIAEETADARRAWRALTARMGRGARVRLALRRAFVSPWKRDFTAEGVTAK